MNQLKSTDKKTTKTHLVVFFKISQILKTDINPYRDTIENTSQKNAKFPKKTTKKLHDWDMVHKLKSSSLVEERKLRLKTPTTSVHFVILKTSAFFVKMHCHFCFAYGIIICMENEDLQDDLLPEYDLKKLQVRGVGPERKSLAGKPVIQLEPDVAEVFPATASVNEALRFLIRITKENNAAIQ